jgi:hypothetical protein
MMAMEKEDGIQQVTAATDVYAFGMTIVEVRIFLYSSSGEIHYTLATDPHWSFALCEHKKRCNGSFQGYEWCSSSTRRMSAGHRQCLGDVRSLLGC